jgi:Ca2+-binding EF-hand superfamily protein
MFGGSDSERNERSLGMLRSMDRNGNGKLEPDEVPEYRRPFVSMMVSRMGGNASGTVDLNDLARKAASGSSRGAPATVSVSNSKTSVLPTDPLVPYFGEKEPEQSAVLAFGQREPEVRTAGIRAAAIPAVSQSDQVLRTARQIMNQFDKNKNGLLDKDKGEWGSSLPFNADAADKNRDGRISMAELLAALGSKANVTTGAAAVAVRQSDVYDHLPPGMPDWFFERDKDNDGQISMTEYLTNGQAWSEAVADEFRFIDKNNDGVATAEEIFAVLKQVDEEKRLKEEQEKRVRERRSGAVAQPAPPQPGQPPQQPGQPPQQPGQPPQQPDQPPQQQPGQPPQPGQPQPASPTPAPVPQQPNWRPGGAVPQSVPSNAPYSSGTSSSSNRDGRGYDRGRSDRDRGADRYRRR